MSGKIIIPDGISLKKEQPKIIQSAHELKKPEVQAPAPGSPAEVLEQFMSDEAKMLVASAIGMSQQAMSGAIPKEAIPELRRMADVLINAATLIDSEIMSTQVEPFIEVPHGKIEIDVPETDDPDELFEISLRLRATARLLDQKVAALTEDDGEDEEGNE